MRIYEEFIKYIFVQSGVQRILVITLEGHKEKFFTINECSIIEKELRILLLTMK